MATITKKSRKNKYHINLTGKELNTITIALALLNIQDMEKEMEEQGLSKEDVVFDHLKLFSPFAEITKLYPEKELEKLED